LKHSVDCADIAGRILLGVPKCMGGFTELRPIYQGCRALTFALARLSC